MARAASYDLRRVKVALNQRLHAERRWAEFEAIREQLKREGVPATNAWRIAAQSFPPLDGSPIEVSPPDGVVIPNLQPPRRAAKSPAKPAPSATKAAASEDPEDFVIEAVPLDDDDDSPAESIEEPFDGPPVPPPPPKNGSWVRYAKPIVESAVASEQAWAQLAAEVAAAPPRNKPVSPREGANWVFQNYLTPVDMLEAAKVPDMGSLGLLRWVKSGAANYTEFIRTVWSKLMPTKAQMDDEDRYSDDGRQQFSMLEDFEQSLSEAA